MAAVKVRATRALPGPAWDELTDVEIAPADSPGPDVDVLVVVNEPVDLDLYPRLALIADYSVGYDRIGVDAAAARGVAVSNTPGVLDAATADLAFALLLAAQRRVVEGDRQIRAGGWKAGWAAGALATEVTGSTLGIVGLGRIGQAMARRARGFEMRILYTRRTRLPPARERELGVEHRELDDLLAESDSVSIHVPRTPETEGLIDKPRLALLRDGAVLVNTARGEVVDEPALVRELVSGRIRAGLDVFAHEPDVPEELYELPNVVLTPHIGSATATARHAMTRLAVDNVLAVAAGRPPLTPVA